MRDGILTSLTTLVLVSYLPFTRLTAVPLLVVLGFYSSTEWTECTEWMLPSRLTFGPMLTLSTPTESFSGTGICMKLSVVSLFYISLAAAAAAVLCTL